MGGQYTNYVLVTGDAAAFSVDRDITLDSISDGPSETILATDVNRRSVPWTSPCDISIDDGQSSRRHCSVVKLTSGFEVADLGSTNGTLVNSTLIKKRKLIHGDTIRIGAVEIVFHDPGSAGSVGEMTNCFLVYAKGERKGQKVELSNQRTTFRSARYSRPFSMSLPKGSLSVSPFRFTPIHFGV